MEDLKKVKVLYVEDDLETRVALTKFLKRRVGKVFTAASGKEGIEQFKENKPDIIIADLLMPEIGGLEMIEKIRSEGYDDCHVLITTTISELNTIIKAVDLGIDHYIIKPIDTDELEQKLLHMVGTIIKKNDSQNRVCDFGTLENKGVVEDEIRKEFLKILKSTSGKGARDVSVFLRNREIDIIAYNAMTIMETTVLNNPKNVAIIEQNRKLFYGEIASQIEQMAGQMLGVKLQLLSIEINGIKGVDKLMLTIV